MISSIGHVRSTLEVESNARASGTAINTIQYANNANCAWLIEPMAETKSITLRIHTFDTEKNYDFLKVFLSRKGDPLPLDKLTQSTPIIALSGSDMPPTQVFNTDRILVTFTSDSSTVARGIDVSYSTNEVDAPQEACYGVKKFDADTGVIATGGPANYKPNTRCGWSIQPRSNPKKIMLSFKSINLEQEHDYLFIYQGSDAGGNLLKTITGIPIVDGLEVPMLDSKPGVYLDFRSDANLEAPGFVASYHTMSDVADEEVKQYCDAESLINERSGLVTDNTAPLLGYKPNTACRWLIKPVRGGSPEEVVLSFSKLSLEKYYDFLYVYDGDSSDPSSTLLARLHGSLRPEPLTARSGIMTLRLETDDSNEGDGFDATFITQALSPTAPPVEFQSTGTATPTKRVLQPFFEGCPARNYTLLDSTTGTAGHIVQQGYANDLTLRWAIRPSDPPASMTAMLTYLNTEEGFDFVHIYDKPPCLGGQRLIMLTGRCGCKLIGSRTNSQDAPRAPVPADQTAGQEYFCLDCAQKYVSLSGEMYIEFKSDAYGGGYEEFNNGVVRMWSDGTVFRGFGFMLEFSSSYHTVSSRDQRSAYAAYSGASAADGAPSAGGDQSESNLVVISIASVAGVISAVLATILLFSLYKQKRTQTRTGAEPSPPEAQPAVVVVGKKQHDRNPDVLDMSTTGSTKYLSDTPRSDAEISEVRGYTSH